MSNINTPPPEDGELDSIDSILSVIYGDDEYEGSDEYADEYGHVGFYLGDGEDRIHVLGDPAMSEETKQALLRLAQCAREWLDTDDTLPLADADLPFAAFDEGEE